MKFALCDSPQHSRGMTTDNVKPYPDLEKVKKEKKNGLAMFGVEMKTGFVRERACFGLQRSASFCESTTGYLYPDKSWPLFLLAGWCRIVCLAGVGPEYPPTAKHAAPNKLGV